MEKAFDHIQEEEKGESMDHVTPVSNVIGGEEIPSDQPPDHIVLKDGDCNDDDGESDNNDDDVADGDGFENDGEKDKDELNKPNSFDIKPAEQYEEDILDDTPVMVDSASNNEVLQKQETAIVSPLEQTIDDETPISSPTKQNKGDDETPIVSPTKENKGDDETSIVSPMKDGDNSGYPSIFSSEYYSEDVFGAPLEESDTYTESEVIDILSRIWVLKICFKFLKQLCSPPLLH